MGLTGLAVGAVVHVFPVVLQRPKYTVLIGFLRECYIRHLIGRNRLLTVQIVSIVPGLVLLILSDGGRGNDYWAFLFPSFFIGSSGMFFAFLAIQVSVIQALPPRHLESRAACFRSSCRSAPSSVFPSGKLAIRLTPKPMPNKVLAQRRFVFSSQ